MQNNQPTDHQANKKLFKGLIIAVLIIGLGILYHVYIRGTTAQREKPHFSESETRAKPVPVQVKKAFIGELTRYVTASGITEAFNEVNIQSQVTGQIKMVRVREGEKVNKGELLAQVDDRLYRIALKEAQGALLKARLEFALMKKEAAKHQKDPPENARLAVLKEKWEKAQKAYEEGKISQGAFLKIDRKFQIALILSGKEQENLIAQKSGVSAAEAQFLRAKYNVDRCRLTAPFSGIVGELRVHTGELVGPNQTLMKLVDLSRLKLKLQVLETEFAHIRVGENIRVNFAAFPDTSFNGRVTGIDPAIDPKTRTGVVTAEVDNPDLLIKSGMFATVRIATAHYRNRLLVPRNAVVERDQRKLVFIVRNKKAFWCYVQTGLENDDYIEITSSAFGLKPGEPVIVDGQFALAHDAPVQIVNSGDPKLSSGR